MNKKLLLIAAIVIGYLVFLVNAPVFSSAPIQPSYFTGTVKVNDVNVAAGTVVSAWINGVQYANYPVAEVAGVTIYQLYVPADNLDTIDVVEGGKDGDTVNFKIGELSAAQTGTWNPGSINKDFNLSAATGNVAPEITEGSSVNVTMSEDASPTDFSLALNATDADLGDTLTWSLFTPAAHGTAGATGTGVSTAVTYTPDSDYFGSDSFVVQVSDGVFGDNITVNVTIEPVNDGPVVSDIPDQTVYQGSAFTIINLDDYVNDIDNPGSEISWSYSGSTNLTVSITDRVATITTDGSWTGDETITFKATDPGDLFDEDTATFSVIPYNAPLVADIPDQMVNEGSTFTTITLDDYVTDMDTADADIAWTYVGNSALTVNITGRVATITIPNAEWYGSETITFRATDPGGLFDTDAATFTVSAVNDAPVVSEISDQSISEGSSFTTITLDDFVSDADNSDAEINWSWSGNTELTVSITNRVATISIPDENWNGSETITFRATDPFGAFDEKSAAFTVTAVNDPPVITGQAVLYTDEDIPLTLSLAHLTVTDPDNAYPGDFTLMIMSGTDYTFEGDTITPAADFFGTLTVPVKVNDGSADSNTYDLTLAVEAVNDAPVITGQAALSTNEDTSLTLNLADLTVTDPDDVYPADFTFTINPGTNYTVADDTISPTENFYGALTVPVFVNDGSVNSNTYDLTISVTAVNDAPFVSVIPDQLIIKGSSFTTINLDDFLSDVDDEIADINWTWSGNTELVVSITDRVATITKPAPFWVGSESITFTATDPGALEGQITATFTALDGFPYYGQRLTSDKVTFNFPFDGDPDSYNIQLSLFPDFQPLLLNATTSSLPYTYNTPLINGNTYYWRIRYQAPDDTWGEWLPGMFYALNLPLAPLLDAPANGFISLIDNPVLTWKPVPNAIRYELQISDSDPVSIFPDFTEDDPIIDKADQLSHNPTLANGKYYWRVRAVDALDVDSPWSVYRSFTVNTTPPVPAKVVLVLPASGNYLFTKSPALTWTAVPYAEEYEVQIGTNSTFTSLEPFTCEDITVPVCQLSEDDVLQENVRYYWRVRAVNNVGEPSQQQGLWSSYRYYTVNTTPPAQVSPLDGAIVAGMPLFRWGGVTGAKTYGLQYEGIDDSATESDYSFTGLTTSHRPPIAFVGDLNWRAGARDALGNWKWSEPSGGVAVDLPVAGKVVLSSPASGIYISDTTPELTWFMVPDSHHYEVQISKSYLFSTASIVSTFALGEDVLTTEASDKMPVLNDNTRYYWRVRAVKADDSIGTWSSYRYFNVDVTTPAVPVLYAPADKAFIYDTTPALSVRAASGARYYRFQVADSSDFSNVLVDSGSGSKVGTTYIIPAAMALPYREVYFWRASSVDLAGNVSVWSAPRSFTLTFQRLPAYGAYTTDTTPTFYWYAVSGATGYELLIFDDVNENLLPGYPKQLGRVSYHTIPTLSALDPGQYLWQLRVQTPGGWIESPMRPLTIADAVLKAPLLTSPARGTYLPTTTPILEWERVDGVIGEEVVGVDKYEIWVDNSSTFSSREYEALVDVDLRSEGHKITKALPDALYYWRIRTIHEGVPGPWSGYSYFRLDTLAPAVPLQYSPADGYNTYDNTPSLSVRAVSGANRYCFQLATDAAFTKDVRNPVCELKITSTGWTVPLAQALPYDEYWWRVKAFDAAGNESGWSLVRELNVTFQQYPLEGFTSVYKKWGFSWYGVPGATGYELEVIYDTGDLPDKDKELTSEETAYIVKNLGATVRKTYITFAEDGNYAWRMRAFTPGGEVVSPWRRMTVLPSP